MVIKIKNNKFSCFRKQKNRRAFFHSTSVIKSPDWIVLGFMGKLVKGVFFTLISPSLWKAILGICASIAGLTVVAYIVGTNFAASEIIDLYERLVAYPEIEGVLNTLHPTLTDFNRESAELFRIMSLERLTTEECELFVKFCVASKNYMVLEVLIDTTNQMVI